MSEAIVRTVPKKFYRYFLKGLSYYTFRLNRACTLLELQAYVFLKSLEKLDEAELTTLSEQVMEQLVSTGVAHLNGGCYRLSEFLRPEGGEPAERNKVIDPAGPSDSSIPAISGKTVKFSNEVTVWNADETVCESLQVEEEDAGMNSSGESIGDGRDNNQLERSKSVNESFDSATDTLPDDENVPMDLE